MSCATIVVALNSAAISHIPTGRLQGLKDNPRLWSDGASLNLYLWSAFIFFCSAFQLIQLPRDTLILTGKVLNHPGPPKVVQVKSGLSWRSLLNERRNIFEITTTPSWPDSTLLPERQMSVIVRDVSGGRFLGKTQKQESIQTCFCVSCFLHVPPKCLCQF